MAQEISHYDASRHPGAGGPGGGAPPAGHVHRQHRHPRPASPGLRGRGQLASTRRWPGVCNRIEITIHRRQSVTVCDNGRGIPVGINAADRPQRAGGGAHRAARRRQVRRRRLQGGQRACTAWASRRSTRCPSGSRSTCSATARLPPALRARRARHARWSRSAAGRDRHHDHFHARHGDLHTLDYHFETLAQRFREMAFLTQGPDHHFRRRARRTASMTFYFEGGIVFVRALPEPQPRGAALAAFLRREASQRHAWSRWRCSTPTAMPKSVFAFANNINTVDGGTHLTGFRSALTRTLERLCAQGGPAQGQRDNFRGEDVREGLTAIVSVKMSDPQFESQTKSQAGQRRGPRARWSRSWPRRSRAYLEAEPADRASASSTSALTASRARAGGPPGARPGDPQERAGEHDAARQAGRLLRADPSQRRALHRRGRLGRRLGQAGPRPALPGHPARCAARS